MERLAEKSQPPWQLLLHLPLVSQNTNNKNLLNCFSLSAPSDFIEAIQILTFERGDTEMCGSYVIINDEVLEDLENFNLQLSTRVDRVTVAPAQGTVTIVDDDGKQRMSKSL